MNVEAKSQVFSMLLYPHIQEFIEGVDINYLSSDRKDVLDSLVNSLRTNIKSGGPINLNFICTHNSRRSHLGQIWARTMAIFYGFHQIHTYSGGTEATAIYKSVLKALQKIGFEIIPLSDNPNPVFGIKIGDELEPIIAFSKKYNHDFNPKTNFVAVITCNNADENCPLVFGAKERIPIKYLDPKSSDGSPEEEKIYSERSVQIAKEMKYVFSKLNGD